VDFFIQTGMRKIQRKGTRSTQNINRFKNTEKKMTLFEMFERFMSYKQTEGLAKPTIHGYYEHFHYENDYLGGDVPNEEVTVELFREYIGYMLNDQSLQPTPVNVRIRTNRAFLRYCYQEGWIELPIHEKFKPIKTPEDEIQVFTPAEVKALLNVLWDFEIE
jgi:integrase/recombinase XerD